VDLPTVSPSLLTTAPTSAAKNAGPSKIHEAAQQFEALLLGELLQTAHPSGGWLGGGEDGASDTASSLAVQQLAVMMAKQGGIGLADLVTSGLECAGAAAEETSRK
jgi:Rod binding domain-containing protein